jgi:Flp pilus assembly protein TadG
MLVRARSFVRNTIVRTLARLCDDRSGTITTTFALTMIPVMSAVGAAVDYSRANAVKSSMQMALDSAVLAGGKDGSSNWAQVATNVFNANIASRGATSLSFSTAFSTQQGSYQGSASATVPTVFMSVVRMSAMQVAVRSTAQATAPDNSCILTLDKGQLTSHVSLTLNGAPIINLSGCSIRSNTALECNGHDGNVTKSIASGLADGCGNPSSYIPPVPDIYAALANGITKQCGSSRPGVSWTPGVLPTGAGFIRTTNNGRTEYHVCGDLSLSGTGSLTGDSPSADTLVVIENGSLNVGNNAAISVTRMGVVLTGNNSVPSAVYFPNGNGKTGQLTLSPPIESTNPWQGVALYQDPSLTNNIDNKWGPGADFNADGLVYLGNSNVVTDGNTSSSNAQCSKFVMNTFTTNGRVNLNFDQSVASCAAIGLKQWGGITVHLIN